MHKFGIFKIEVWSNDKGSYGLKSSQSFDENNLKITVIFVIKKYTMVENDSTSQSVRTPLQMDLEFLIKKHFP